jgi:hypothetical protein
MPDLNESILKDAALEWFGKLDSASGTDLTVPEKREQGQHGNRARFTDKP